MRDSLSNYVIKIQGKNDLSDDRVLIAALIRQSRKKCKKLAIVEFLSVFRDLSPAFVINGPMSEVARIIIFAVDNNEPVLLDRLQILGYSYKFWKIDFEAPPKVEAEIGDYKATWKKNSFGLSFLFEQDKEIFRSQASDKREFTILDTDGNKRKVIGYRGDGSLTGRRALPVEDCRLLSNIVCNKNTSNVIDPFAGAGGIVFQIKTNHKDVTISSIDIAPEVSPGLSVLSTHHYICDSSLFDGNDVFDGLATEVPFADSITEKVCHAFTTLKKNLSKKAIISVMCADYQADRLINSLIKDGYRVGKPFSIDRKGTGVVVIIAFLDESLYCSYSLLENALMPVI